MMRDDTAWARELADERERQVRTCATALPHVAVIGDAFVDEYVYADRVRLNPEAPTLCVTEGQRETANGGGANVSNNVAAMLDGVAIVQPVFPDVPWPVKRRYVVDGRIVFRADENDVCEPLPLDIVRHACEGAKCVVVADYGKGAVTDDVWRVVAGAGVPVFAHTKGSPLDCRPDARTWTFFVNEDEYDREPEWCEWHAVISGALVTTYGAEGADVCDLKIRTTPLRVPAFPAKVVDVCGAGDSFMAAYVATWVRGERDAVALLSAGCAAGAAAVEQFGTSVVTWADVLGRCEYAAWKTVREAQPEGLAEVLL